MKALLAIFALVMVLGLAGCANTDLPDDYVMPCTSDGCLNDPANPDNWIYDRT